MTMRCLRSASEDNTEPAAFHNHADLQAASSHLLSVDFQSVAYYVCINGYENRAVSAAPEKPFMNAAGPVYDNLK